MAPHGEPGHEYGETKNKHGESMYVRGEPRYERGEPRYKRGEIKHERGQPKYDRCEPGRERRESGYACGEPRYGRGKSRYEQGEIKYKGGRPKYDRCEPGHERRESGHEPGVPWSERREPGYERGEPRYDDYHMTVKEKIFYAMFAAVVIFILCHICYRSYLFSILVCPLGVFYPSMRKRQIIRNRKKELNMQFKDMLYALSSSLSAGSSVEKAFRQLPSDLSLLYPDSNTSIIREARLIALKLEMNESAESALNSFAERSGIDDIMNFADVFQISKRAGANMVEVIRNTTNIINDRIEIEQEIDTMLAERRFEQKVLYVLPPAMITLLSLAAADYMEPVFSTFAGYAVMSAAVVLIGLAYFISAKINNISI
jgi:tight adherence protein B